MYEIRSESTPISKVHAACLVSGSSSPLGVPRVLQDPALHCVQLQQGGRVLDTPVQHAQGITCNAKKTLMKSVSSDLERPRRNVSMASQRKQQHPTTESTRVCQTSPHDVARRLDGQPRTSFASA